MTSDECLDTLGCKRSRLNIVYVCLLMEVLKLPETRFCPFLILKNKKEWKDERKEGGRKGGREGGKKEKPHPLCSGGISSSHSPLPPG